MRVKTVKQKIPSSILGLIKGSIFLHLLSPHCPCITRISVVRLSFQRSILSLKSIIIFLKRVTNPSVVNWNRTVPWLQAMAVKRSKTRLINAKLSAYDIYLTVSVNFIDYVGAYLSYIIIAIALFGGMYDNIQPSSLSAEISRVSYRMYCPISYRARDWH